jgi:hypothetical protein
MQQSTQDANWQARNNHQNRGAAEYAQPKYNIMKTHITNTFTGYTKTITTVGTPSVATIAKHIRASKARDCKSTTYIMIDGVGYDLSHGELIRNGN